VSHDDPSFPCLACLGLLQRIDDPQTPRTIVDVIEKEGFQADSFLFSVSTPTATLVRQYSLWVHLSRLLTEFVTSPYSSSPHTYTLTFIHSSGRKEDSFYHEKIFMDFPEPKEIFRKVMGKPVSDLLGLPIVTASPLTVLVTVTHQETETDFRVLTQLPEAAFQLRKVREKGEVKVVGDNINNVTASLKRVQPDDFRQVGRCPPAPITQVASLQITCDFASVFVAGRYLKFARDMSHTPWVVDGEKLCDRSIEEIVMEPIKTAFESNRMSPSPLFNNICLNNINLPCFQRAPFPPRAERTWM